MRIMFVGDSLKYNTGLAYVMQSLIKRYANAYGSSNICYVGITNGDTTLEDFDKFEDGLSARLKGISIYNADIDRDETIINFNRAVYEFVPNIVISLHDPWRLPLIAYSQVKNSFFWVAYSTIESREYPETLLLHSHANKRNRQNIREILSMADMVIPCSEMGYNFLKGWIPQTVEPVYLGLDNALKSSVTKDRRAEIYGVDIPENAFVFYSMGTNSPRKQMDKIIDAFAAFMKDMKNTDKYYLVMHTGSEFLLQGADLMEQIREYGLEKNVIILGHDSISSVSKEQLYNEYAVSDCYISLPGGEGFGYGYAESILHNKPVIYINHGGHVEYCKDCGISVPVEGFTRVRNSNIKWVTPDIEMAAAAMRKMVSDPKFYNRCVETTVERAKVFDWDRVIFPKFFKEVLWKYEEAAESNMYGIIKRGII
jgi:glycosyltransferase involved in cell wall biosynthesis